MGNILNENNMDYKKQLEEKNKEIDELKKRIKIYEDTIKNFNITIKNCNKSIEDYRNIINQQDIELKKFNGQKRDSLKSNSRISSDLVNINDVITVNFISKDNKVNLSVPCVKTNTFAEVEEKLYKQYPELRETNNNFTSSGRQVLRFKTIDENKIGFGLPVILCEK